MELIFLTMGIFLGVVLVMSVGVLFKRKPIQGSCGGIANLMGSCDICEKKTDCMEKFKAATDCH
jgi:hypothetical protein